MILMILMYGLERSYYLDNEYFLHLYLPWSQLWLGYNQPIIRNCTVNLPLYAQ